MRNPAIPPSPDSKPGPDGCIPPRGVACPPGGSVLHQDRDFLAQVLVQGGQVIEAQALGF